MILDALLSLLLLATIGYSWKLSRKIASINDSRKELENFIKEFNQSISRAEVSIATLRTLSNDTDISLKGHIEKARFLTNDLAFLTYKGNSIANRLENHISGSHIQHSEPASLKPVVQDTESLAKNTTWKFPEKPATAHRKSAGQSEMSPSKKQALDSALALMAKRKKPEAPENKIMPGVPAKTMSTPAVQNTPPGDISNVRQSLDSLRTSLEMKS